MARSAMFAREVMSAREVELSPAMAGSSASSLSGPDTMSIRSEKSSLS